MRLVFIFIWFAVCSINAQSKFDYYMTTGISLDNKGKSQLAVLYFDSAISLNERSEQPWFSRGIAKVHIKNFSEAVVDFNKAIYLQPNLDVAYLYRHIAYRQTENFQFAFGDINTFLTMKPNDTIGRNYRFDLSLLLEEWDQAFEDLTWLSRLGETTYANRYLKFSSAMEQSKAYDILARYVEQLMNENPTNKNFRITLIYTQIQIGKWEQALKNANIMLLDDPENLELLKIKADALFYMKRIAESEKIFLSILEKNPYDANLMADYGHCLLQLNKWESADEWLTKSIRDKNGSPAYAYLGRGIARYNLGKIGIACSDWERSLYLGEKNAKIYLNNFCKDSTTTNGSTSVNK